MGLLADHQAMLPVDKWSLVEVAESSVVEAPAEWSQVDKLSQVDQESLVVEAQAVVWSSVEAPAAVMLLAEAALSLAVNKSLLEVHQLSLAVNKSLLEVHQLLLPAMI